MEIQNSYGETKYHIRTRNRKWTPEEDKKLFVLVSKHGYNFNLISESFPNKIAKSCRQRWINQLDPSINRKPYSLEEQWLLFLGVTLYGTRWCEIQGMFENRPAKQLKNYWNTTRMRRKIADFRQTVYQVFLAKGLEEVSKKIKYIQ